MKKNISKKEDSVEARASRKSIKQTLIWMGVAFVGLVIVIILILLLNRQEPINDDYFVTDDSKIVLSLDSEMASLENSEVEPDVMRIVYYRDGNKISNVKIFYEYDNDTEAREAYDSIGVGDFATGKQLSGKYIVLQAKRDTFEGLTATQIEEQVESLRSAGALAE